MASGNKYTALTGGGAGALDAVDGAALVDGDIAIVMTSGLLYFYELDADSALAEASPGVIAPDTNAGDKRWVLQRTPTDNSIPVGTILPWIGGYFTNNANAGFTSVLGNDYAALNAYVNADGYYGCNGAELNLPGSAIYNGAGRYLPNLSDDRFLMGSTAAGSIGGSSTMAHTHDYNHAHNTVDFTLTATHIPAHRHPSVAAGSGSAGVGLTYLANNGLSSSNTVADALAAYGGPYGGGTAHNHGITVSVLNTYGSSNTQAASNAENRPKFLACLYMQKAI